MYSHTAKMTMLKVKSKIAIHVSSVHGSTDMLQLSLVSACFIICLWLPTNYKLSTYASEKQMEEVNHITI